MEGEIFFGSQRPSSDSKARTGWWTNRCFHCGGDLKRIQRFRFFVCFPRSDQISIGVEVKVLPVEVRKQMFPQTYYQKFTRASHDYEKSLI